MRREHDEPILRSEGLAQEREIGEWVHRVHAASLQMVAEQLEIEPRLQVKGCGVNTMNPFSDRKAWRRNGKSENGFIVFTPHPFNWSRSSLKSTRASR